MIPAKDIKYFGSGMRNFKLILDPFLGDYHDSVTLTLVTVENDEIDVFQTSETISRTITFDLCCSRFFKGLKINGGDELVFKADKGNSDFIMLLDDYPVFHKKLHEVGYGKFGIVNMFSESITFRTYTIFPTDFNDLILEPGDVYFHDDLNGLEDFNPRDEAPTPLLSNTTKTLYRELYTSSSTLFASQNYVTNSRQIQIQFVLDYSTWWRYTASTINNFSNIQPLSTYFGEYLTSEQHIWSGHADYLDWYGDWLHDNTSFVP